MAGLGEEWTGAAMSEENGKERVVANGWVGRGRDVATSGSLAARLKAGNTI